MALNCLLTVSSRAAQKERPRLVQSRSLLGVRIGGQSARSPSAQNLGLMRELRLYKTDHFFHYVDDARTLVPVALPNLGLDQHDPCRLHEQDTQGALEEKAAAMRRCSVAWTTDRDWQRAQCCTSFQQVRRVRFRKPAKA